MSIRVNDFRWEPGKNDAVYIKLLESSRDEWQKIAQKAIAKLKALSKAQETADAVPVEWLREKMMMDAYNEKLSISAENVLEAWEQDNNPSPTCGPDYCDID